MWAIAARWINRRWGQYHQHELYLKDRYNISGVFQLHVHLTYYTTWCIVLCNVVCDMLHVCTFCYIIGNAYNIMRWLSCSRVCQDTTSWRTGYLNLTACGISASLRMARLVYSRSSKNSFEISFVSKIWYAFMYCMPRQVLGPFWSLFLFIYLFPPPPPPIYIPVSVLALHTI